MAKCLDCGQVYAVYGGSEGSNCANLECKSDNIDTSKEIKQYDK